MYVINLCTLLILYHYLVSSADTTDVQTVRVTLIEGLDALTIQCEFITGSNATGCMVVLTGLNEPYHVNLTRNPNSNSTTLTVALEHPLSCYTGVKAFDIEADSSVGSVPVRGQLKTESGTLCTPIVTTVIPGKRMLSYLQVINIHT